MLSYTWCSQMAVLEGKIGWWQIVTNHQILVYFVWSQSPNGTGWIKATSQRLHHRCWGVHTLIYPIFLSGKNTMWIRRVFGPCLAQVLSYFFVALFFSSILGTAIFISYLFMLYSHTMIHLHFSTFWYVSPAPAPSCHHQKNAKFFEASFVASWMPATPSVTSWRSSRWTPCAPWWSSWPRISTSSCWRDSCRSRTSLRKPPGSMPNSMPIWGGTGGKWWDAHLEMGKSGNILKPLVCWNWIWSDGFKSSVGVEDGYAMFTQEKVNP